jgi:hypothetical protein
MSVKHLYLAAVATLIGCATTAANPSTRTSGSAVLTAVEISEKHADVNTAYDAVARLRPNWLAPHGPSSSTSAGTTAAVFVDDQPYGTTQSLRNIPAYQIASMQYYDVTQAGGKFGIRAGGTGAIEVRLKQP